MIQPHSEHTTPEQDPQDLPTLVTFICNLMTCYATRPCMHMASAIEQHIGVLLNSPASDELGDWIVTFEKLQSQWNALSERHARTAYRKAMAESKSSPTH